MGRYCKVCMSTHRDEYESMRLEKGLDVKEIWKYAIDKYNENISYASFQRHFKHHVEEYIETIKRVNKLRDRIVKEEIKKDIEIAKQLRRNLEICSEKIESIIDKGDLSKEDESILLDYLGETRMIIEQLLKWSSKIQLQTASEDEIYNRILNCIRDFPYELIVKFKSRWEHWKQ